jgi:hypothetical protein
MKFRSVMGVLAVFACTLLLAGSAMAQGGELVRAEWGVQGRRVDVTARVRTFVRQGIVQFEVTRFNLGIDPAPHQNKDLIIRIRHWDGDVKEYSYPERSTVNLELDPEGGYERRDDRERHDGDNQSEHDREERSDDRRNDRPDNAYQRHEQGVRILRAYYGAEGQFINVTEALRSRMDDGRLLMHVDNYTMGGDPLPGAHKTLRILYLIEGQRRNIVVDEKTDVRLP